MEMASWRGGSQVDRKATGTERVHGGGKDTE